MPAQLFTHYGCPWVRRAFGLHFGHFVDMLNVFALGSGAELVLRFPGPDEELICECAWALPLLTVGAAFSIPCAQASVRACMHASHISRVTCHDHLACKAGPENQRLCMHASHFTYTSSGMPRALAMQGRPGDQNQIPLKAVSMHAG